MNPDLCSFVLPASVPDLIPNAPSPQSRGTVSRGTGKDKQDKSVIQSQSPEREHSSRPTESRRLVWMHRQKGQRLMRKTPYNCTCSTPDSLSSLLFLLQRGPFHRSACFVQDLILKLARGHSSTTMGNIASTAMDKPSKELLSELEASSYPEHIRDKLWASFRDAAADSIQYKDKYGDGVSVKFLLSNVSAKHFLGWEGGYIISGKDLDDRSQSSRTSSRLCKRSLGSMVNAKLPSPGRLAACSTASGTTWTISRRISPSRGANPS